MLQPKHEWRLIIGRTGTICEVWCDGVKLTNVQAADLHLEAGQLSSLHLRLASTWREPLHDTTPLFHHDDDLSATGEPRVYVEIDGRKFRIMEMVREGDLDEKLFRPIPGRL